MRALRPAWSVVAIILLACAPTIGRAESADVRRPCDVDIPLVASQIVERQRVEVDATAPLPEDVDGLKALLAAMRHADQEIRALVVRSLGPCGPSDDDTMRPVFAAGRAIDERNREALRRIVQKKGWPVISIYGEEADQSAFLIAQHADRDRAFQKDVLAILEQKYRIGDTSGENYALLFDRVRLGARKRQRYGSQGRCKGNDWVPDPIEDPRRVDALRKEVGLEPMRAYRRRAAAFVCAEPAR